MRYKIWIPLASVLVATTFATSSAQTPSDTVHAAKDRAQRAADVEGALQDLESDGAVRRNARTTAEAVLGAARDFRPIQLPRTPADWQHAGLDLSKAETVDGQLVQTLDDGTKVTFTVDPGVQRDLEQMLDNYNVPHSGIVLVDPPTGRVLALVSHTEHDTPIEHIAQKSTAPSASVFKIVTAAALVESDKINPEKPVCYHGGRSRLTKRNIKGDKRRDHKCASLDAALAWSINSIIAKLAFNHLEREELADWAERFGYNQPIPFELPVEVSTAEFVEDPYERARTAAGFWHTYLSPLHGALIGATLANDGVMMQPSIIERVEAPDGDVVQEFEPRVLRKVMSKETARLLGKYMRRTTREGTARKYFNRRGFPRDIAVSGKTGTLSNKDPYLGFTWFVGFGQDGDSEDAVGVAGLVCNTPIWRIKGAYAASEAVREYFERARRSGELAQNH
jgi:cell division protein FtsI/penicillin-binding protein 2